MKFLFQAVAEIFSSEASCPHETTELIAGNCRYEDVSLQQEQFVITTYRPYYPQCADCGETLYDTRYTATGEEHPLGEPVASTRLPRHVTDTYLKEHHRYVAEVDRE